jgi:hypothetical protein
MADITISGLTSKATPATTDEIEIQETGGGMSKKTTIGDIWTKAGSFVASAVAALTTAAESWIGPSSTTGIYFKSGNVGIGTTSPGGKLEITTTRLPFIVDSKGYVGIGTTTPSEFLEMRPMQVVSENANIALWGNINSNSGDKSNITFKHTIGGGQPESWIGQILATTDGVTNRLDFKTGTWNNNKTVATAMSILGSGNVGIGTTGPLTITEIQNGLTTTGAILTLSSKETSTVDGDVLGRIDFRAALDAAGTDAILAGASIWAEADDTFSASVNSTELVFGTATTSVAIERMRLDSAGNLGLGTPTPGYQLQLSTDSAGKPGASGQWTVVSDERIKTGIELADLVRCYEIVKALPLKRFSWAEGVYTEKQASDRTNLGWMAKDVQSVFPKAVSVKPFTLFPEIPDGEEEYEEQDFVMEQVEEEKVSVEIRDGQAVHVKTLVNTERKVLLFDRIPLVDEAGAPITKDVEISPATETEKAVMETIAVFHDLPRMVKKTRAKVRHDVIEDCLDLNSGQIYAALYGAVQEIMQRLEALELKAL